VSAAWSSTRARADHFQVSTLSSNLPSSRTAPTRTPTRPRVRALARALLRAVGPRHHRRLVRTPVRQRTLRALAPRPSRLCPSSSAFSSDYPLLSERCLSFAHSFGHRILRTDSFVIRPSEPCFWRSVALYILYFTLSTVHVGDAVQHAGIPALIPAHLLPHTRLDSPCARRHSALQYSPARRPPGCCEFS
jgi:hypothetical protein